MRLGERVSVERATICPECQRAGFHPPSCSLRPSPRPLECINVTTDDNVELQCKACNKTWTEPKADFLARFGTGRLGHDCPAGASL